MSDANETDPGDATSSETDRTVAQQAKQQPPGKPDEGKPDEGIRPSDLTSENDGGAEG